MNVPVNSGMVGGIPQITLLYQSIASNNKSLARVKASNRQSSERADDS
jgi:hypothetical protein